MVETIHTEQVQRKSLQNLSEICKACYHKGYTIANVIESNTAERAYLIAENNIGKFYKSWASVFLVQPLEIRALVGSYLLYYHQPQKGFGTPQFSFTDDSLIWSVDGTKLAALDEISASRDRITEYFRYVPILQQLKASLQPESFIVYKHGVQVIQPNFFSIDDRVPDCLYEKAKEHKVAYQMLMDTEKFRFLCDMRIHKEHIREVVLAAISLLPEEDTKYIAAFLENVDRL
jgi:hypothetical protein